MDYMAIETVTTVPVAPVDHPSLTAEILRMDRERNRHRRQRQWAWVCVKVGVALIGLSAVGIGTFIGTLAFMGKVYLP